MKLLAVHISRWQSKWTRIQREGALAIYTQVFDDGKDNETVYYNVVWIRHRAEKVWPNGKVTPEREALPTESEWGLYGWTFRSLQRAEEKFAEAKVNPPKNYE
jgi:hypothetical protein